MNARSYVLLFVLALVAAAGLAAFGRRPHVEHATPRAAAPAGPRIDARIEMRARAVEPARTAVPLGATVSLRVRNADDAPHALTLAGYDDAVHVARIAARDSVIVTFVADKPGDDFAWLVDGQPAGVFAVTGSHLVEGHR